MIAASRRQASEPSDDAFRLHLREARRASLHRRLLHASLAALAAALLSLFLPLGLPWRALLVLAAGLVGALWPLGDRSRAALRLIRQQSGLSYETALDLLEGRHEPGLGPVPRADEDDPYGLKRAVIERARLGVRGFQGEARPAWWLPALLIAAALVALPAVAPELAPAASRQAGSGATGAPQEPAADPLDAPEAAAPQPPAPGRADAPAVGSGADERAESPGAAPPDEGAAGQAPLSRYLESLRERPAPDGGVPTESADEGAGEAPDDRGTSGDSAGRNQGQGSSRQAGEPSAGEQGGAEPGATPPAGTEGPSGESVESGAGGGEEPQAAPAAAEDGSDPAAEGTARGEGELGQDEAGERLEEGGSAASGGGDQDGGEQTAAGSSETGEAGEGADSAGLGAGAIESTTADGLDGADGQQEQLRGVLREGPESVAGSVRLPGNDEVDLPSGTSFAPYQGAAEEALTEGDLPLDYQEIIRRYFR